MMWGGGLFVLICIALMIWMMSGHGMMGNGHGDHDGIDRPEPRRDARGILAERFARGEISEEEFEQRKQVLERQAN